MKKFLASKKGKIIAGICGAVVIVAIIGIVLLCFGDSKVIPIKEPKTVNQEVEAELTLLEQDKLFLESQGIPVPDKTIDFEELQANTNEDIYAWVYIPGTKVDEPILQHPTDNTFYLNSNLDGSEGYPGCIFTENYNNKNFTDHNTVLYGHNMKDGTMFGDMKEYLNEDYFDQHPYLYIYTPTRLYAYQVYAAYQTDDKHLLLNYDFSQDGVFKGYLQDSITTAQEKGMVEAEWSPSGEEYILTLSTCTQIGSQYRFLVQGKLVTPSGSKG